jgi:hypothetical protein
MFGVNVSSTVSWSGCCIRVTLSNLQLLCPRTTRHAARCGHGGVQSIRGSGIYVGINLMAEHPTMASKIARDGRKSGRRPRLVDITVAGIVVAVIMQGGYACRRGRVTVVV